MRQPGKPTASPKTMELKSRDLLDFITGPVHTARNALITLLHDWQLDLTNRVAAGEAVSHSEFDHWQRLAAIADGLMAAIVYEMSGVDLYEGQDES